MKNYNPKFIKKYIEQNKDEINYVTCGMKEDWSWTAETVYEEGKYLYNLNGDSVLIAGIGGSYWATPVMEVKFKDGRSEIIKCFKEDNEDCSDPEKDEMIRFAFMTGGMDDVENR